MSRAEVKASIHIYDKDIKGWFISSHSDEHGSYYGVTPWFKGEGIGDSVVYVKPEQFKMLFNALIEKEVLELTVTPVGRIAVDVATKRGE